MYFIAKVVGKVTRNVTLRRLLAALQCDMILREKRRVLTAQPMLAVFNAFVCFISPIEKWNELVMVDREFLVVWLVFTMHNRYLMRV